MGHILTAYSTTEETRESTESQEQGAYIAAISAVLYSNQWKYAWKNAN